MNQHALSQSEEEKSARLLENDMQNYEKQLMENFDNYKRSQYEVTENEKKVCK